MLDTFTFMLFVFEFYDEMLMKRWGSAAEDLFVLLELNTAFDYRVIPLGGRGCPAFPAFGGKLVPLLA